MMISLPEYTAVIRTLGTAGEKYQILLNSLIKQTHPPKEIIVYLAEGYDKPKETVGIEKIVYVKKGMVAQRALKYKEVNTEWILFLDDDVAIEPWGMEKMFSDTLNAGADVCAFDAFPHHKLPLNIKIAMALILSSIPRLIGRNKGYRVNFLGTDTYNPSPKVDYAWSTTNAGPAFIARKKDFLDIHFEDDLWLDETPYAIPEDKIMYYKMHLVGLKIITHFNSGFKHLDAGASLQLISSNEKKKKIIYSSTHNQLIFEELYLLPSLNKFQRGLRSFILPYKWLINFLYLRKKFRSTPELLIERKKAIVNAKKNLISIKKNNHG